jgi:hypothetical protein
MHERERIRIEAQRRTQRGITPIGAESRAAQLTFRGAGIACADA